jgi:predicted metal-dependent hydrolase
MEKTNRLAKAIGVKPISIKVKSYKSRWGSCSSKGDVSYNWKIMQAPSSVIDYVVIHELCHLIEHNHSSKFWNMVEKYCPEWRKSKEWLKRNSMQLLALDKV